MLYVADSAGSLFRRLRIPRLHRLTTIAYRINLIMGRRRTCPIFASLHRYVHYRVVTPHVRVLTQCQHQERPRSPVYSSQPPPRIADEVPVRAPTERVVSLQQSSRFALADLVIVSLRAPASPASRRRTGDGASHVGDACRGSGPAEARRARGASHQRASYSIRRRSGARSLSDPKARPCSKP